MQRDLHELGHRRKIFCISARFFSKFRPCRFGSGRNLHFHYTHALRHRLDYVGHPERRHLGYAAGRFVVCRYAGD